MITSEFSDFGKKLTRQSGILMLMDDIGKPLPKDKKTSLLGGGNPARIPEVELMYRKQMLKILNAGDSFENLLGHYDSSQGRNVFINEIASYLSATYKWKVGPENIAITNGSQSAFFFLFNLFSGTTSISKETKIKKSIVFPLVPEYTGYADQNIEDGTFVSIPSCFSFYEDKTFKYCIDFDLLENYLENHNNVGALCVSRPTNPTGNVLTNAEIKRLAKLAEKYELPLFIDNAYGLPWPDIVFSDNAEPYWNENIVLSMSLSKIGLPSMRTGIIVADKKIITALSNMNAIATLSSGSMGQALASGLIVSGKLIAVAKKNVRPYYLQKSKQTQKWISKYFNDGDYAIHKSEGAIFLWILMKDLSISTIEFYRSDLF